MIQSVVTAQMAHVQLDGRDFQHVVKVSYIFVFKALRNQFVFPSLKSKAIQDMKLSQSVNKQVKYEVQSESSRTVLGVL